MLNIYITAGRHGCNFVIKHQVQYIRSIINICLCMVKFLSLVPVSPQLLTICLENFVFRSLNNMSSLAGANWCFNMSCILVWYASKDVLDTDAKHTNKTNKQNTFSLYTDNYVWLIDWLIDWVMLNVRPTKHFIGHIGDGFYRSNDPWMSRNIASQYTTRMTLMHWSYNTIMIYFYTTPAYTFRGVCSPGGVE